VARSIPQYRGRFAPSPTGPLHLGSLIAALASFLDARHSGGAWLVRMEDLDPPREIPGAANEILQCLHSHGLRWDEEVMFQSRRGDAYAAALGLLAQGGHVFTCRCTRAMTGADGVCRGNCRALQQEIAGRGPVRAAVPSDFTLDFVDLLQGPRHIALGAAQPDFVVRRRDGLAAYQLAVVVDDAEQGITHVVRGADLLESTPRQIFLQHCLDYATPRYAHVPVITTAQGQKFSKQNHAPALAREDAVNNLRRALRFLCQRQPPDALAHVDDVLAHAIEHWSLPRVPATLSVPAGTLGLHA